MSPNNKSTNSFTQFKFENYSNLKMISTEAVETSNSSSSQGFCHPNDLISSIFDSTSKPTLVDIAG